MAQLAEQLICNQRVGGSIPSGGSSTAVILELTSYVGTAGSNVAVRFLLVCTNKINKTDISSPIEQRIGAWESLQSIAYPHSRQRNRRLKDAYEMCVMREIEKYNVNF